MRLQEPAIASENRHVVESALASFEQAACEFADCLMAAKNVALGCEFTATFDKRMRKLPGVRVI